MVKMKFLGRAAWLCLWQGEELSDLDCLSNIYRELEIDLVHLQESDEMVQASCKVPKGNFMGTSRWREVVVKIRDILGSSYAPSTLEMHPRISPIRHPTAMALTRKSRGKVRLWIIKVFTCVYVGATQWVVHFTPVLKVIPVFFVA